MAKIQIIIVIFPLLILNYLINLNSKFKKDNIRFSKYIIILFNFFIIIFFFYFLNNYQYKRVDKILFIFFIFFHFIYFYLSDRKIFLNFNLNFSLLLFLIGCCSAIIFFKICNYFELSSFHPVLTSIIGSPITQMGNINTGYQTSSIDNLAFISKIYNFFIYSIIEGSHFGRNEYEYKNAFILVFNKLSNLTYILSILISIYCIFRKKYLILLLILFLNISITLINFVFNFRPYNFYLIYSLPLNLILVSVILKVIKFKKISSIIFLLFYLYLSFNELKFYLNNPRVNDYPIKNMEQICLSENINNKNSYMSYWQKKYDVKFLSELCADYNINYKSFLKE